MPLSPDSQRNLSPEQEYLAAFQGRGQVLLRNTFKEWVSDDLLPNFSRSSNPQLMVDISGFSGVGKTSLIKLIRKKAKGVSHADLDLDLFMTTERGSPERKDRLKSLEKLLAHFCDREALEEVLIGTHAKGKKSGKIPLGKRYRDGQIQKTDDWMLPKGKKLITLPGTLAGETVLPILKDYEIPRIGVYVYGPPELAINNAILRDLEKGRTQPEEMKQRFAERMKELKMLFAIQTRQMINATVVLDNTERLEKNIGERSALFPEAHAYAQEQLAKFDLAA